MEYLSFSTYLRQRFGCRVGRISVNAGFSCPNRDGTVGERGCVFCNEAGFSEYSDTGLSVREQISASLDKKRQHGPARKFILYFQNGSNTYAEPAVLAAAYEAIRQFPEFVGLSVSTRPDCVDADRLAVLAGYCRDYDVWLELGIQTTHDQTLQALNRCHTYAHSVRAVHAAARLGIRVAAHVILGLPGETREQMRETARALCRLPLSGVKFHVFHVLRHTEIARRFRRGAVNLFTRDEYVGAICDFLEYLPPEWAILRVVSDASAEYLIAPQWMNDKQAVLNQVREQLRIRRTRQGSKFSGAKGETDGLESIYGDVQRDISG